jgi:cytoskeletal protein CcmA (bactofilin family)
MAMFDKHKTGKQNSPEVHEPKVSQPAPTMSTPSPVSRAAIAMIGQGISVTGDVKADSSLKVEGRIEGRSVQCADEVEIAESGQVTANIMAKVVKVSGTVFGDIGGTEKVLISRSGRVQGNIIAPRVQLEDGALFRGSIDMNPAESAAAGKPAAVKPAAGKAAPADKNQRPATSAPSQNKPAAQSGSKEPGLNLKSG